MKSLKRFTSANARGFLTCPDPLDVPVPVDRVNVPTLVPPAVLRVTHKVRIAMVSEPRGSG